MKLRILIILFAVIAMTAFIINHSPEPAHATADAANPFLVESALPFHAPPFDKIKDSDYQPAIEEGMKDQLSEIEKIADNPEPPGFANTLEAMERTGALLTRVTKVFFNL